MKTLLTALRLLLSVVLLLTLLCAPVLAGSLRTDIVDLDDEDDANPNALTLLSSSTPNGARSVPLNPLIQLNFNKNVVHFSVAVDNADRYHLVDPDGGVLPIRIIKPDDQMQHAVRRSVFIMPEANLLPDTIYTLVVDSDLRAKNGDSIDDAHVITFKTGSQTADRINPLLESLGMNVLTFSSHAPLTEYSVPGASPDSPAHNRPPGNNRFSLYSIDTGILSRIVLSCALCALVLVTVLQLLRHKRATLSNQPDQAHH